MPARPDFRSDTGATLVEVLVALAILGVAAVAILAGLQMTVVASDMHRKQSTGGAYVRSYAEAIERFVSTAGADNYKPCASADAYNVDSVVGQLNLPGGYQAHHTAAAAVTATGGASGGCSADTGVQRLDLTVKSDDGRASEQLTIVLRMPCDPETPCAG